MSEPLNCNESVDIVTPTREEWDQNQFRATPGPAPSRCAPVPPTLPPPYHERICSLHPLGKHTNSSCRNQFQTARDVHIPHSQASCRTRGGGRGDKPPGTKNRQKRKPNTSWNNSHNWTYQPGPSYPPPTYLYPINTPPPPNNVHNIKIAQDMINYAMSLLHQ